MKLQFFAVFFLFCLAWPCPSKAVVQAAEVSAEIDRRIEGRQVPRLFACPKERICGARTISQYYVTRRYRPVWSDGSLLLPQASSLLARLRNASDEGLRPEDYHLTVIEDILLDIRNSHDTDPGLLADLDILLTNAFLVYGAHMLSGRVDPKDLFAHWSLDERNLDPAPLLDRVFRDGDVAGVLDGLRPANYGYDALREALKVYRGIGMKGGWSPVALEGRRLAAGDSSRSVSSLRRRLAAEGFLDRPETAGKEDFFDMDLDRAVRAFQARHGLLVDGVVGPQTLSAINVPVESRIRQIELNLERIRWLPEDLGGRHLVLNIADFSLKAVENGEVLLHMKAIVGRTQRQTPLLSSSIDTVVLNPAWNVPHSIAVKDILPAIRKDPGLLSRKGFRVLEGWGAGARELDPWSIRWDMIRGERFPYRLRQDPGPQNALGNLKFSFPNTESVYLHGTPARELFRKSRRDFSSGCIRVEDPLTLASWILGRDIEWNRENLEEALSHGETRKIRVPDPVPIHIIYWTAWADKDGTIQFRPDLYGQDDILADALGMGR